jgi:hypothetical protein
MPDLTLIHLVSEQTMQNLLPVMALRPRRVVQVVSQRQVSQGRSANLANAVTALGRTLFYRQFAPEFLPLVVVPADSPTVAESMAAVARCLQQYPKAVVNLTGATKLMSIGAWEAARAAGIPVLYCGTSDRRFVVEPPGGLAGLPTFDRLAAMLTVEAVMAAHGTAFGEWRFEPVNKDLIAFGQKVFQIRSEASDEIRAYDGQLRQHFRCGRNERLPDSKKDLRALHAKPLPVPTGRGPRALLEAAAEARLLRRGAPGQYFPTCAPERGDLEHLSNLLEGSWFELHILGLARQSPRLVDLHWSVQPRRQELAAFGETDIVCIDTTVAGLHVVSCKTSLSGRQPLEHMEALAQRRRDLGGSHARATLCVLHAPDGTRERVQRWGALLGIRVLIGDEIMAAFLGSPP